MVEIADGFTRVRERIARAVDQCGRDPASVRLVAVSKTKSAVMVREAYAAGQRDFGENYVQELRGKRAELSDLVGIRWHAIGHVQTNKAKDVVACADMVQSVDSVRLASELGKQAAAAGV